MPISESNKLDKQKKIYKYILFMSKYFLLVLLIFRIRKALEVLFDDSVHHCLI